MIDDSNTKSTYPHTAATDIRVVFGPPSTHRTFVFFQYRKKQLFNQRYN